MMLDGPYSPRNAIPLDPEQFRLLLDLVAQASRGDIPTLDPEKMGLSLLDKETGVVREIRLTDHPLARMALTVKTFYRNDAAKYYSAMFRLFGFLSIIRHPRLAPWSHDDGETTSVHDAVIEAAATARLDGSGQSPALHQTQCGASVPIEPFLKLVRQIEREKYA